MGNKTYIAGIDIGVRTLLVFLEQGLYELFLRIRFLTLFSRVRCLTHITLS